MPRKDQVTLTLPGHRHRHCNRWTRRASSLTTIRTSEIIPVELNSILYRNERALAWLHQMWAELRGTHGDQSFGKSPSTPSDREAPRVDYAAAAAARLAGMSAWMWDGESARWHDLDLSAQPTASRLAQESAASYMPLWARACEPEQAARAVNALSKSRLLQVGGISTTLEPTGQQWDWPNAWPPLQQMLIEGVADCGAPGGAALAEELSARWLASNLLGWRRDHVMHEKYDATQPGRRGGGGEYEPQIGFGWSNGVALWLLDAYASSESMHARIEALVRDVRL